MICGSFATTGLQKSEVTQVAENYRNNDPPPLEVTAKQADDGTWMVVATWPDCPSTTTHTAQAARETAPAGATATASQPAASSSSPVLATAAATKKRFTGFDANHDCGRFLSKIVAARVDFVVRYYSHNPGKNLSFSEGRMLSDSGIDLVVIWESGGDRASFFSAAQGTDDATSAYNMALIIGQPPGTPIYFAVDYDATSAELNGRIIPYFKGVASGFNTIGHGSPAYTAGVYGSGLVCATLFSQGLVTHTWLSQSTGFAGSRTYTDWNIKQALEADPFGFGFSIDPDEAKAGYGGFRIG